MRWVCILLAVVVANHNALAKPSPKRKNKKPWFLPIENGVMKSDEMRLLVTPLGNPDRLEKPAILKNGICSKLAGRPCCKAAAKLFEKYADAILTYLYRDGSWKLVERINNNYKNGAKLTTYIPFRYPRCRPDGFYKAKQCNSEGYKGCYCVNAEGSKRRAISRKANCPAGVNERA